jgi:hypothetical protein
MMDAKIREKLNHYWAVQNGTSEDEEPIPRYFVEGYEAAADQLLVLLRECRRHVPDGSLLAREIAEWI